MAANKKYSDKEIVEFLDDIFKYWEKVSYKYAHV
jgi:hypothetical protein